MRHTIGRRRRKPDEHSNHEAWAIPYADLLTLLLAFFVVMYAISSVNAGKYRVLSDSLFTAFRGTPRTLQPIQVGEKQDGNALRSQPSVLQQAPLDGPPQLRVAPAPVSVGLARHAGDATPVSRLTQQAAAASAALSRVADQVEHAMEGLVKKDLVTIRRNDFWIEVEMRSDILFPSGSARLAAGAVSTIERLGAVLAPFPNPIRVEGHTDDVPIKTAVFSSNWELSAARAGSVVRVLSNHGVAPQRLAVIGFGEQRPLKGNDTAQGRNANRRVVVVILSTELVRQSDPAGMPMPPAGPEVRADGAVASPEVSPQAIPAPSPFPAPSVPVAQPGSTQTTAAAQQTHSTSVDAALVLH